MNSASAALFIAVMSRAYWPLAVTNASFKQNMHYYSSTGAMPIQKWTDSTASLVGVHVFRQMGRVPHLLNTEKLMARGRLVRYIGKDRAKTFHPKHVYIW